ncbi:MAG: glycosyltransferase family 2 protein, partial [Bacteroidota bacterium]
MNHPHWQKQTWVIIPAYNEGAVIRSIVRELLDCGYQIIVVDDGSEDDTPHVLSDLPLVYVRHPLNLGQGAALQTGMKMALQLDASYVLHFDADGQHPVSQIPDLLAPLVQDKADICLGSRFLSVESRGEVPFRRRLTLQVGRIVNYLFTGMWLSDAHNGFRAMN